jgi:hypothetical protein
MLGLAIDPRTLDHKTKRRAMKIPTLTLAILVGNSIVVLAENAQDHRLAVVSCLGNMAGETTWGQCRNLMFALRAVHPVGGDGHLACLTAQREGWRLQLNSAPVWADFQPVPIAS